MLTFFRLRPTTAAAILVAVAVALLAPSSFSPSTRALLGWDAGAAYFIVAIAITMMRTDLKALQRRARELDGGRASILVVTLIAAAMSVVAIVVDLAAAKASNGYGASVVALAVATIALSWTLVNMMFALHYAHEFYMPDDGGDPGGLKFPGDAAPLYGDFVHFAFVIGVANQTADIMITSPSLRRVVTAHGIAAFVFNTTIIALTINIAAGLIGGG
ncbi:MAG: hypothetical protein BGP06_05565 [Rhizobiales bacterium 65-9]|nr:DUF1345 domain-containing protein [Hyphomicrobiales bacterium]OJY35340.1 MAG: hypothetical protein BGP06_05565 [Rhizobiales bacterium 65-9]